MVQRKLLLKTAGAAACFREGLELQGADLRRRRLSRLGHDEQARGSECAFKADVQRPCKIARQSRPRAERTLHRYHRGGRLLLGRSRHQTGPWIRIEDRSQEFRLQYGSALLATDVQF